MMEIENLCLATAIFEIGNLSQRYLKNSILLTFLYSDCKNTSKMSILLIENIKDDFQYISSFDIFKSRLCIFSES